MSRSWVFICAVLFLSCNNAAQSPMPIRHFSLADLKYPYVDEAGYDQLLPHPYKQHIAGNHISVMVTEPVADTVTTYPEDTREIFSHFRKRTQQSFQEWFALNRSRLDSFDRDGNRVYYHEGNYMATHQYYTYDRAGYLIQKQGGSCIQTTTNYNYYYAADSNMLFCIAGSSHYGPFHFDWANNRNIKLQTIRFDDEGYVTEVHQLKQGSATTDLNRYIFTYDRQHRVKQVVQDYFTDDSLNESYYPRAYCGRPADHTTADYYYGQSGLDSVVTRFIFKNDPASTRTRATVYDKTGLPATTRFVNFLPVYYCHLVRYHYRYY